MAERTPVPKRMRFEVLRRDNHACRYCGACAPDAKLTIDHVFPVALGGKTDPTNLVTACTECNSGKASVQPDAPIVADVARDAERWAEASETAQILRGADRYVRDRDLERFDALWTRWSVGGEHLPREATWRTSIPQWLNAGLDMGDLGEAIEITMGQSKLRHADRWKYFCGVAWKMVEQHREQVVGILEDEEREWATESGWHIFDELPA